MLAALPLFTPGCSNVLSPSLSDTATPASRRPQPVSAPNVPVSTLTPISVRFPSAVSSPSKLPIRWIR